MRILLLALLSGALFATTVSCSTRGKRVVVKRHDEGTHTTSPAEQIAVAEPTPSSETPPWSYDGARGPQAWGSLSPFYIQCQEGQRQSPIDLIWKKPETAGTIQFHYNPSSFQLVNDGHTLRLEFGHGNSVLIHGQTFDLERIHFHSPSEHKISGREYDLEMHLIHKNHEGEEAVIAVLYNIGERNLDLQNLFSRIPAEKNRAVPSTIPVDPLTFIPYIRTHYLYSGSSTTPPCHEGVLWAVFNTPKTLSQDQLLEFKRIFPQNNRPLQKLNGRPVKNY